MDRYRDRRIVINDSDEYFELFEKRGVQNITQHIMKGLSYPSQKDINKFTIKKDIWKRGDAFHKYAAIHYENRGELWWVIAHFNNAPTDAHMILGQTVYIPFPIEAVISSFGL